MRNGSRTALIFLIILCVSAAGASAQNTLSADSTPPPEGPGAPAPAGELETSDQTVKIEGSAEDGQIAERLRAIFDASGRYENLTLSVRDGVVFIEGTTTQDNYRVWASDLARRTEDVVAVVNNLEIDPPPVLEQDAVTDQLGQFFNNFIRALPLIGVGLVLLVLSVLLAKAVTYIINPLLAYLTDSQLLRNVARKVIALLVVVGGVVLFLQISGLTGVALTVLSGTGVLGLVVGFAFRDIAENFLASILLSVQTPFHLGDVIEVAGYTGVVQKVTPRGTVLVDFDGNHIQIANSTVYKSTLKNLTANPRRRLNFDVGIGYDASVKVAQDTAMKVLRDHAAVLDDPEPMVLVDSLGASTINLKLYFWIDGHKYSELKIKSATMRRVVRALERAQISLPDESREVIFPDGVPQPPAPETPAEAAGRAEARREHDAAVTDSDLTDQATDAEGDLTSEVDEIKRQAAESRDPEKGPDIVS